VQNMVDHSAQRAPLRRALIQSRGLSRMAAAAYVGISPTTFDQLVKDGRMPPPKRINSRTVWDIRQLDEAFEALPSDDYEEHDPFASVTL
jgi:predicted DNA-binding transcriptional regulator AlpA